MNAEQIAAYRAESARMRTAEQGRPERTREFIESHDRAVKAALNTIRDLDHGPALIENLPCEMCGEIEQHGRHGLGHMFFPIDPASPYVVGVIREMWAANSLWDVLDAEHGKALADHKRRRLVDLAAGSSTPVYVADTVRMMLDLANDVGVLIGHDHAAALGEDIDRCWEWAHGEQMTRQRAERNAVRVITAITKFKRGGNVHYSAPKRYEIQGEIEPWTNGQSRIFARVWVPKLNRYDLHPEVVVTDSIVTEN